MRLATLIATPAEGQHQDLRQDEDDEHRVDVLRVVDEQRRPRVHVLQIQHADGDGGDRVAGMPNTSAGIHAPPAPSCWPRPARRCPRRAGAELLGLLRQPLGHRVRHPRRDVGTGAGQRAHQPCPAPSRAAARVLLQQRPHAGEHVAEQAVDDHHRLVVAAKRSTSTPRTCRSSAGSADAARQLGVAEGVARRAGQVVQPDAAHQQAQQQRHHALQRVARRR